MKRSRNSQGHTDAGGLTDGAKPAGFETESNSEAGCQEASTGKGHPFLKHVRRVTASPLLGHLQVENLKYPLPFQDAHSSLLPAKSLKIMSGNLLTISGEDS